MFVDSDMVFTISRLKSGGSSEELLMLSVLMNWPGFGLALVSFGHSLSGGIPWSESLVGLKNWSSRSSNSSVKLVKLMPLVLLDGPSTILSCDSKTSEW